MDPQDISRRFTFHPATDETAPMHETVRDLHLDLAERMNALLPEGREKSLVITKIEESMMFANAAIARRSSAREPHVAPTA